MGETTSQIKIDGIARDVLAPVNVYIDVRQLSQALLRYQLGRAARGPSTLSGGSLITDAKDKP